MFPKGRLIEGLDSLDPKVKTTKSDIKALWRWLNDDLRFHLRIESPLDSTEWVFNYHRPLAMGGLPGQRNGFDCGLYAVHVVFAFCLQAPLSKITRERVHLYQQKLLLFLLDDDDSRDILIPDYTWYDKFRLR